MRTGAARWLMLSAFIAVTLLASAVGSLFTSTSVGTWYRTLAKPTWTPPGWVFAPVWTALYVTMAVAAWLVWQRAGFSGARVALALFAVQLALNVAWPAFFFWLRSPSAGSLEIVALWIAILATLIAFWQQRPLAGALLLPYLAWVTFAALLTFRIWRMNG